MGFILYNCMDENEKKDTQTPAPEAVEEQPAAAPVAVVTKPEVDLRAGQTVRVHVRIKEGEKDRIQVFEGIVLSVRHGLGADGSFTVRKVSEGIGVERIFPVQSPLIEKIEIKKRAKVRQATLYHLRDPKARRLKIVG